MAKQNAPTELVTHMVYPVDNKRKRELLSLLITTNKWEQVFVFTRTKHGANRLAQQLTMQMGLSPRRSTATKANLPGLKRC